VPCHTNIAFLLGMSVERLSLQWSCGRICNWEPQRVLLGFGGFSEKNNDVASDGSQRNLPNCVMYQGFCLLHFMLTKLLLGYLGPSLPVMSIICIVNWGSQMFGACSVPAYGWRYMICVDIARPAVELGRYSFDVTMVVEHGRGAGGVTWRRLHVVQ
jgi:hypothetical protein